MQRHILVLAVLLVIVPSVTGIYCYICSGCSSTSVGTAYDNSYTSCYTYQSGGLWYRGGLGSSSSCSSVMSSYSSGSCCYTSYCNGAETKGVSMILASVAALVALFRSL